MPQNDQQSLQAKQQYLHREIIEQQYDPEEFQQFMDSEKGLDLDQYTMQQLVQVVSKFKGIQVGSGDEGIERNHEGSREKKEDETEAKIDNGQLVVSDLDSDRKPEEHQIKGEQSTEIEQKQPQNKKSNDTNLKDSPLSQQQTKIPLKIKINLKQMIIPQYKPPGFVESTEPKPKPLPKQQNKRSMHLFSKDDNITFKKENPINDQSIKSVDPSPLQVNRQDKIQNKIKDQRTNLYREDEDDQQEQEKNPYDGAFIDDGHRNADTKQPKKLQQEQQRLYNRESQNLMRQSTFIPSQSNKLPFIIVKKPNISSMYKQMQSTLKIDKQNRKTNPFFQGFSIKVKSFSKKQSSSLFKFPYIIYNLETTFPKQSMPSSNQNLNTSKNSPTIGQAKTWNVERRFNDFKWLHQFLSTSYYGLPIPPIPAKTKMRSFDDEHLSQRMNSFERFLNKCVHIDQIVSDPMFEAFLYVEPREESQAVKKKFMERVKSRDTNIMQFLKGEQVLSHVQGITSISTSTKTFISHQTHLLEHLNRQLSSLSSYLKLASQHSVTASNIFRQLSHLYKSNHQFTIRGEALFDVTSEYISELSYKLDNEAFCLRKYVGELWDYEEMYVKGLLQKVNGLDKHRGVMETKFREFHLGANKGSQLSESISLQPNKASVFSLTSTSSPSNSKPFSLYKKTRQLYQTNLSLTMQQLTRHLNQDLMILSKEFLQGLNKHVGQIKEQMMTGVDLVTKAMAVVEGKQLKEVEWKEKGGNGRQGGKMMREM